MADPRFGEGFPEQFDATNRLTPFKEKQKGLPEAVQFSHEAREALQKTLETQGWPERPELANIEEFFDAARSAVSERWHTHVTELISQKNQEWLSQIPDNEDTKDIRALLSNPETLDLKMSMQQMGALEDLKNYSPEAWCSLMLLSSERQLAAVATTREWIKGMNEADFEKFGFQKAEMEVFVELAAIFGKYIDSAYVRQIELSVIPGGTETTPLTRIQKEKGASEQGIDRVYDLQRSAESEEIDVKTYSEVFPNEWPKIVTRFDAVSKQIKTQCAEGRLPEIYLQFADYLESMAASYGSTNTNPEQLYTEWQNLMKKSRELAEAGFPLMVIPQGCATVAGDANKVDVEIRLGVRTKETTEPEKLLNVITASAQKILDSLTPSLEKPRKLPPVILNIQPFAFGPNLYWMTRGESDEERILSHTGAVREVAQRSEVPCLKRVFSDAVDETKYVSSAIVATSLHEVGHGIPTKPAEDKEVEKRTGLGENQTMIEELKAWCSGVKAFLEVDPNAPELQTVDTKTLAQAVIGAHLDYLKNKSSEPGSSGERYYLCGVAIITRLLDKNIIQKDGNKFALTNPEAALGALREISDEITQLYTANDAIPQNSIDYAEKIKQKKNDPMLQEIIQILKAA